MNDFVNLNYMNKITFRQRERIVLVVEKKKQKNKEQEVSSSEFKHKPISDDEISSSEIAHFIKKMMKRSNKFNKKDVKEML